jgi:type II secretion system protein C
MVPLRPLAWLIDLALAAALSYAVAALSMQMLERRLESDTPALAVAAPALQEQAEQEKIALSEFQPVLGANIFGARRSEVKSAAPAAPGNGSAAGAAPPRVPLVVTLTGTMTMGDRAFAMIADASGRNEKVYRLWDCLPAAEDHPTRNCAPTQGKLIAVRKQRIIVKYQGEQLTFDLAQKPASMAAAVVPGARQPLRPGPQPVAPASQGGAEGSGPPFPITQEGNVLQVRVPQAEVAKAFENFSDVLKQARVVPYSDETGSGFQIRNIRPGSIFERIGLTNFDKIKAVNGEPITTADQALRLLTMFRNEREISMDLERRDQKLQLNYVIE